MFLNIGSKLKKYRKVFNLKLSMFEKCGFSAAYISYIENNKRVPPIETTKELYNALVYLTDGEISKHIILDDFIKNEYEEAEQWLIYNCNIDFALSKYEKYHMICEKYNLSQYLIKIDEILAYHYQSTKKYFKSNEYFINCISYLTVIDEDYVKYYIELGINFQDLGMYEESILNFKVALKCISERHSECMYRIYYELARSYCYLKKLDKSYLLVDKIIKECPYDQRTAAAILLKENILKLDGKLEEGEEILKFFIEDPLYPEYLKYAYHNLGYNLSDQCKYDEALNVLSHAVRYRESDIEIALTNSLIGEVYYNMNNLEISKKYYKDTKDIIFKKGTFSQKKTVIERLIEFYFDDCDVYSLEDLIKNLNFCKDDFHYRELDNIVKINILKQSLSNKLELTPVLETYIYKI